MKSSRGGQGLFRVNAVTAGCLVLVAASSAAFAQTQPAQQLETVVVTGIRKGIEDAISAKKSRDTIVEAISAEDIGKLPDPSVADSLARLPGVAAQRNRGSGKAQQISVRGMSPDFNGGLLNGREVASSGDSRGVDFDLYPGELLSQVLVYKTPHAALVGQGLSSTIDLRTLRPLDFRKMTAAVNYREQRTGIENGVPNGEGTGDRKSFSYVDQFFDRKVGVALGFARFTEQGASQPKINTWGGWSPEVPFDHDNNPATADRMVKVPGGFGRDTEYTNQTRDGAMGVLQFRPVKEFETVVDFFYSRGRQAFFKKGIEGFVGGSSDPHNYRGAPRLTAATVDANGFATSGTVNNFKGVVRNHNEGTDDKLNAVGLNARWKGDGFTLYGDVAESKVTKVGSRYETTAGVPGDGKLNPAALDTISWTGFTGSNHADLQFKPGRNYSDPNVARLTDVMGWGGGPASPQAGYVAAPRIGDHIRSVRLGNEINVNWFNTVNSVEIGVSAVTRDKTASTEEGFLVLRGATDPYAAVTAPGAGVTTAGGIPVMTWDPRGSLGTVYALRPNTYGAVINRTWGVKEEVTTAFVKANLDTEWFGLPVSGNAGVQLVDTDQTSVGFVNDSGRCLGATAQTCQSVSGGKSYTDFLPSLNLNMDLGGDRVLRFGLGRVLARPKMSEMRANIDAPGVDNSQPIKVLRSSGGNPELEPFRANAIDLSLEQYFGSKGYVSAAVFNKQLSSYVVRLGRQFDFTNFLTPNTVLPPVSAQVPNPRVGILSQPLNGNGGSIRGIELAVNVPLGMVWKPLEGFGVMLNHSNTRSAIDLPCSGIGNCDGSIVTVPLPGLSRKVNNARIYFERWGFQVAFAARQRSDFLGEVSDYKDDKEYTFIKGETVADFQIGYEVSQGWLKGLSVLFQANNVNNAKFQQYTTDRNNPTRKETYGKTYLMGINYKL